MIECLQNINFAYPQYFFLLLLIPFLVFWEWKWKTKQQPAFNLSSLGNLPLNKMRGKAKWRPVLPLLRLLSFTFLVIAMARPQKTNSNETIQSEGIDIVLSIDISGSMLAQDFKPNRIEAAKKVAKDFIDARITDRIGLVIFSGESFTQTPLTTDKNILQTQLKNIRSGLLEDGTAIGMGLATAINRLRSSKAKSKVVILLTDGVNNSGLIDPNTALEIAKAYKVRVYTIGVGTRGTAPYPVQDQFGHTVVQNLPVQIDEGRLKNISRQTGGKYYRATDNKTLASVYKEIDRLERSKVEINTFKKYTECFAPWAFLGLIFLFLEVLLKYTIFKTLS